MTYVPALGHDPVGIRHHIAAAEASFERMMASAIDCEEKYGANSGSYHVRITAAERILDRISALQADLAAITTK